MRRAWSVVIGMCAVCWAAGAWADTVVIKVASLAPENSPWGRVFRAVEREIEKRDPSIQVRLYMGGSRGDEKVMVRKVRAGQLDGASITSIGLSQVLPEALVLEAPGLLTSYRQFDCVRDKLAPRFAQRFEEKGFVLVGWGDVGKTYFMGSVEVRNPGDLARAKPWLWEADAMHDAIYKLAGAHATPLTVPDVLQGLSNGVIQTIYASPVAAVSLQWHPYIRFINAKLISIGVGATIVRKDLWDRATPQQQALIRDVMKKWHERMKRTIRTMNDKALRTLRDRGARVVAGDKAQWRRLLRKAQDDLVGRIYPRDLLEEARRLAASCPR